MQTAKEKRLAHNAAQSKWRKANRESVNRTARGMYARNPEYWKNHAAAWRKNNPAKARALKGQPNPTRGKPLLCECCNKPPGKQGMHLDHVHETGHFRGWLCMKCNTAIGKLGDDEAGLLRALDYIRRSYDGT
jgi:hypothetical protein